MARKKLIVIGAGAKAAAIAARAFVMGKLGFDVPAVRVLEKGTIGQSWTAVGGLTDGWGRLCGPGEFDVGFPYLTTPPNTLPELQRCVIDGGRQIAIGLQERFSWQRYLLDNRPYLPDQSSPSDFRDCYSTDRSPSADTAHSGERLSEYMLRGRSFPTHREWAEYLYWVFRSSGTDGRQHSEAVSAYQRKSASGKFLDWVVEYESDGEKHSERCDALVLTGVGGPIQVDTITGSPSPPRLLDAANFWRHLNTFRRLNRRSPRAGELRIAVVGGGGAAATIIDWLHSNTVGSGIWIDSYSTAGALFPRGDGYGERRWLVDPDGFANLTKTLRRQIMERTDAGVISPRLKAAIDAADRIAFHHGKVTRIDWSRGAAEFRISLTGDPIIRTANYVIQARGFDPWQSLNILRESDGRESSATEAWLRGPSPDSMRAEKEAAAERIDEWLRLPEFTNLHIPALAGLRRGPSFASLGSLGLTAARILDGYVGCGRFEA